MTNDEFPRDFIDCLPKSTGYQYVEYYQVDDKSNRWSFITTARRRLPLWRLATRTVVFFVFEWLIWPFVAPYCQLRELERRLREQPRRH